MTVSVLEIRNYLLKPNSLEHFIDYFEEHFIASQESLGMSILGQFRLLGEPNRFVWIRGFPDMPTRQKALQNFYGGPVWAKYGPLANDMMLEWHNVHLLRPLGNPDLTRGCTAAGLAADLANGTISPNTGVIGIDFYQVAPDQQQALQASIAQAYEQEAISVRGLFVAETSENSFARLPVYQVEDTLVVISAYVNQEDAQKREAVIRALTENGISLHPAINSLLLSPTLRSPLRYA